MRSRKRRLALRGVTLAALAAAVGGQQEVQVPANLITQASQHITPDMVPLVELDPPSPRP